MHDMTSLGQAFSKKAHEHRSEPRAMSFPFVFGSPRWLAFRGDDQLRGHDERRQRGEPGGAHLLHGAQTDADDRPVGFGKRNHVRHCEILGKSQWMECIVLEIRLRCNGS